MSHALTTVRVTAQHQQQSEVLTYCPHTAEHAKTVLVLWFALSHKAASLDISDTHTHTCTRSRSPELKVPSLLRAVPTVPATVTRDGDEPPLD